MASKIVARLCLGESWTGQFPLRKKCGEIFNAIVTNTPLYDESGRLVGIIGVTSDARPPKVMAGFSPDQITTSTSYSNFRDSQQAFGHGRKSKDEWQPPWQIPFASSISNLVTWAYISLFYKPYCLSACRLLGWLS